MRKKLLALLLPCLAALPFYAQITPPYSTDFNTPADTIGWSHFASEGEDDWEWGVPQGNFSEPDANDKAWVTNLDGNCAPNSYRYLISPSFDLSNVGDDFVLIFDQERDTPGSSSTYYDYYVDYSIDNNGWTKFFDSGSSYTNWQGFYGFIGNAYYFTETSYINLDVLSGNDNVRFRFRFKNTAANGEGWMIDNFGVIEVLGYNLSGGNNDTIRQASRFCLDHEADIAHGRYIPYSNSNATVTTDYYFSDDPYLDAEDEYITSVTRSIYYNLSIDITMPEGLTGDVYYLLYDIDVDNDLEEFDETDNVGVVVIPLETTYSVPYTDDFEGSMPMWKFYLSNPNNYPIWELGSSYRHRISGAHSGENAWHTSKSIDYNITCGSYETCQNQYIESPLIALDHSQGTNHALFWAKKSYGDFSELEWSVDCGKTWEDYNNYLPLSHSGEWNIFGRAFYSSVDNIKVRIKYRGDHEAGIAIDDFYVGPIKADPTIEDVHRNRYTSSDTDIETLSYNLWGGGTNSPIDVKIDFYWSVDSIFDSSDLLLGSTTESFTGNDIWSDFTFNKPTNASGKYYIFYEIDPDNQVDEMREYNNTGHFIIHQNNYQSTPYFNDFETDIDGWYHDASLGNDDWQWTTPKGELFDEAFSGEKVWITSDTGLVSDMSRMHLYTPVFDLSDAVSPVMEFDMKLAARGYHCGSNMSYSTDGGKSWTVLDKTSNSYTRWYYKKEFQSGIDRDDGGNYTKTMFEYYESSFTTFFQYNGRDTRRNTRYVLDIAFLAGVPEVQFRYNLATQKNEASNADFYHLEGAMIDNFSIREAFTDLVVEGKKKLLISPQSDKIPFFIQIKNQGNYISKAGAVRFYLSQDTLLDAADAYLGQEDVDTIQSDMYHYINVSYDAPANISDYQYLLYDLDVANTTIESNENNNLGHWELAMEGITEYPYNNDFQDTVVDGWYQYSTGPAGIGMTNYRMRTMVAPGEALYGSNVESGYWFSETINNWTPTYRIFHLRSPKFDFSDLDSMRLSFRLFCDARNNSWQGDGGNLEYSTDGGNSWTVLTSEDRPAHNWYTETDIEYLDYEPGWAYNESNAPDIFLRPVYLDISHLRGEPDVTFRFKFATQEFLYGFRMDEFKIQNLPDPSSTIASTIFDVPVSSENDSDDDTSEESFKYSTDTEIDTYVNKNTLYIYSSKNQHNTSYSMNIVNVGGQIIHQSQIQVSTGMNRFELPENLPSGVYFIYLNNGQHMMVEKALILR